MCLLLKGEGHHPAGDICYNSIGILCCLAKLSVSHLGSTPQEKDTILGPHFLLVTPLALYWTFALVFVAPGEGHHPWVPQAPCGAAGLRAQQAGGGSLHRWQGSCQHREVAALLSRMVAGFDLALGVTWSDLE
jgi:hypothetical protein